MMKMNWLLLTTTLFHIYLNVSGTLYYEYSKNDFSPPRTFLSVDKKLNSDGLTICLRFFQHQSSDDRIHLIDNGKHKKHAIFTTTLPFRNKMFMLDEMFQ